MKRVEIDYKEAFYVLAVLVMSGDLKKAKEYIMVVINTPRFEID